MCLFSMTFIILGDEGKLYTFIVGGKLSEGESARSKSLRGGTLLCLRSFFNVYNCFINGRAFKGLDILCSVSLSLLKSIITGDSGEGIGFPLETSTCKLLCKLICKVDSCSVSNSR